MTQVAEIVTFSLTKGVSESDFVNLSKATEAFVPQHAGLCAPPAEPGAGWALDRLRDLAGYGDGTVRRSQVSLSRTLHPR